ncbi:Satratoxin biosynthesis SC5 cluster protein [Paramyrothecium foliicola]|nr:Satratoxin biosynthesis SC5 cluster protein [Paramyrothecium foliicola]
MAKRARLGGRPRHTAAMQGLQSVTAQYHDFPEQGGNTMNEKRQDSGPMSDFTVDSDESSETQGPSSEESWDDDEEPRKRTSLDEGIKAGLDKVVFVYLLWGRSIIITLLSKRPWIEDLPTNRQNPQLAPRLLVGAHQPPPASARCYNPPPRRRPTMSVGYPSPEPVDPAHAAESNLARILGVTTVVHVLAVVAVALRMYTRLLVSRNAGRDDWTMVACLLCACGGWSVFVIQAFNGLGSHQSTIDEMNLATYYHAGFWQSIFSNNAAMALLKISIALYLLRLNPGRWSVITLWVSIGFVGLYAFMDVMTYFLRCKPMAAHWDERLEGTCYPIELFMIFALINTSFNIFTDVLFATIPIPVIWKLQMTRRTRFFLIGILSLGYLAVAMGICKAVFQIAFRRDKDKTFNSWVSFWGFLELNIGIIAACAPSLKPLVSRALNLTEYGSSSDHASRSCGSAGLRALGGSGVVLNSKLRDHYELRSMVGDSDDEKRLSNEAGRNGNMLGQNTANATFYVPGDEDRMGSQEMILRGLQRQGTMRGIVKTMEVTVTYARRALARAARLHRTQQVLPVLVVGCSVPKPEGAKNLVQTDFETLISPGVVTTPAGKAL